MPVREKARPKPRASDEEFVLFLQGIPAHCRWQELKDLIRQTALHIRQAVVYDDHHGFPTGLGQIIVKNEDEAWRTYHRLSTNGWEGQSLVVTLSRTCAPTRPIAGPTKSPSASCLFAAAAAAAAASSYPSLSGYSTPPRVSQNLAVPGSPLSMSPEPVLTTTPEYAPIIGLPPPPPSFIPVFPDALPSPPGSGSGPGPALRDPSSFTFTFLPTTYSLQSLHETPLTNIRMNARHPPSYPGKPTYTAPNTPNTPNTTLHNNTTTSTKNTRRTILIQNLPPHTTLTDLKAFFQDRVGPIEHCHLDTNTGSVNNSGCNKITARITYRTAESAKHAVALFNNVSFMGSKRIRVRVDRGFEFGTDFGAAAGYDPTPTSHGPNHGPSPTSGPGAGAGVSSGAVQHIPTPNPNPTPTTNTTPKSIPRANSTDRCQPLVVNGSGIGRNAGTTSAGAGAKIAVVV